VTQEIDEALSRLAAGDLPEEEARAWRARIAADPAVARSWIEMTQLLVALDHLPLETPSAQLDAAVLDSDRNPARSTHTNHRFSATGARPRLGNPALLSLVLAALVLLIGLPSLVRQPSTVVVGPGTHVVTGTLRVVAGDVLIDVDGTARIAVGEPVGGGVRGTPFEEDAMRTAAMAIAGAVGGAAVTVAVLEGSAEVTGEGEVAAGETIAIPGSGPSTKTDPSPTPTPLAPVIRDLRSAMSRISELEATNDSLMAELEIVRGQLSSFTGETQRWPDDVPTAFLPAGIEARMDEVFGHLVDQGAVLDLDCAEYPCIMLVSAPAGVLPDNYVGPLMADLDAAVLVTQANHDDGVHEPLEAVAVALIPDRLNDEASRRTEYRMQTLARSVGE